ncbi:MAG: 50S ribosomal protein L15 [Rhodospirillaceae bacterium]|nr:50S ribosomal protein L15 [Rhodospirillaceae bacterium]MYB12532.1 50S ribosomal protein L15 [Rhodospirillaceae bacterium]
MKLNELADNKGARKVRTRIGRGIGSGKGKTGGRGHKGQKSRSGVSLGGFEGGQMPLYMRLPKRGFNNIFRKTYAAVNVGRLQQAIDAGKLDAGAPVDAAALKQAGVIRRPLDGVRLLGHGEISAAVEISVAGATGAAVAAVERAGGKVNIEAAAPKPEGKLPKNEKKAARRAERAGRGKSAAAAET